MSHQQDKRWFKHISQSAKKVKGAISDASSQAGELLENTTGSTLAEQRSPPRDGRKNR